MPEAEETDFPLLFVPRLAHYAEAFYLTTGQCFRLILAEDGTGHAQHCPYITEWRGQFQENTPASGTRLRSGDHVEV